MAIVFQFLQALLVGVWAIRFWTKVKSAKSNFKNKMEFAILIKQLG